MYWAINRQSELGYVAIYATETDTNRYLMLGQIQNWLAKRKLYSLKECPYEEFSPQNPLMFVIYGMENEHNSIEKSQNLFRYFLSIGCDIDRPNMNNGRISGFRPIHMVMLTRDIALVDFLIKHGADKKLKITAPHSLEGFSTLDLLARICEKNKDNCVELEAILK